MDEAQSDCCILITGGTGSFGSAMARRLLIDGTADRVVIYSRDECKQARMRQELKDERVTFYVGDIRDRWKLSRVVSETMPNYIFHAAALKRVPEGENHVDELVQTNIIGTQNVVDTAALVDAFVVGLSTDKACYPINAMGMSKAIAERLLIAAGHAVVRYGNVIGSRGSVLEIWEAQRAAGQPITVIDPDMTRYWLPMESALNLVSIAMACEQRGIYLLQPQAASMREFADAYCDLTGADLHLAQSWRSGEKMHECLLTDEEGYYALRDSMGVDDFILVDTASPMVREAAHCVPPMHSHLAPRYTQDALKSVIRTALDRMR